MYKVTTALAWCLNGANPIRYFPDRANGVYIVLTYIHSFAVFLVFWVLLKNDLMKQKQRPSRVGYQETRRTAAKADTYSLVNSIVPNYLVALQSSSLPTKTSFGTLLLIAEQREAVS